MVDDLNPVQYEVFRHRLFNILEEGRIAIKMVSGSAVVVEGGETMCAFYDSDGTPVLVAAGVLLHCMGARDFIYKTIEWYQDDPGIFDGDQFFFNDPYIGGQHLADYVIIKPVFHNGQRIAWTGSIMHTPETGGLEPGGNPPSATEIFQEGIKIQGLKIVERGKFRPEVFNTIVHQVRDPHLVGLDTKAKIAANNVCAKSYLELVDKYGPDFVKRASRKIIEDSELLSRARLRTLPDGTWQSRHYGDSSGIGEKSYRIVCTMRKKGEEVTFDYTGSSPQNEGSLNSTFPATWGSLFAALASQLFWNVPWNGGMFATVKLIAPEGTVVNCNYPAACSSGVLLGCGITQAAHECISKMLCAAGIHEDVNSGWMGGHGNPYFGGTNQYGHTCVGVILDTFAAGIGAAPHRDGVDTGANMMNPTSNISDVEIIELNMPIMYLARRHAKDSGGFGKFRGGMGGEALYMVSGTDDFRMGLFGLGRKVPVGHAIFGGYPASPQQTCFVLGAKLKKAFSKGKYPNRLENLLALGGKPLDVPLSFKAIPLAEYDVLVYPWSGGGGFADPLDRATEKVLRDVRDEVISNDTARDMYGVIIDEAKMKVDTMATESQRSLIRQMRLKEGRKLRAGLDQEQFKAEPADETSRPLRFHEYLHIVRKKNGKKYVACVRCGYGLCEASDNYKLHSLLRQRDLTEIKRRSLPPGSKPIVLYQEYICPGCATLIEVDNTCPQLDGHDSVLWDIRLDL